MIEERKSFGGIYCNKLFTVAASSLIGMVLEVETRNGSKFEGIFTTWSPNFEVVLEQVNPVKGISDVSRPKVIFPPNQVVKFSCKNVDIEFATKDLSQNDFKDILSDSLRDLEKWEPEEEYSLNLDLDMERDIGWNPEDMFKKNETKYGLMSSFKSNLEGYTVQLCQDVSSAKYRAMEARAQRIALEIEGSTDHSEAFEIAPGENEEDLFSAVIRPTEAAQKLNEKTVFPDSIKEPISAYERKTLATGKKNIKYSSLEEAGEAKDKMDMENHCEEFVALKESKNSLQNLEEIKNFHRNFSLHSGSLRSSTVEPAPKIEVKSNLNPNAKEFTFNPNARAFIPTYLSDIPVGNDMLVGPRSMIGASSTSSLMPTPHAHNIMQPSLSSSPGKYEKGNFMQVRPTGALDFPSSMHVLGQPILVQGTFTNPNAIASSFNNFESHNGSFSRGACVSALTPNSVHDASLHQGNLGNSMHWNIQATSQGNAHFISQSNITSGTVVSLCPFTNSNQALDLSLAKQTAGIPAPQNYFGMSSFNNVGNQHYLSSLPNMPQSSGNIQTPIHYQGLGMVHMPSSQVSSPGIEQHPCSK